MTPAAKKILKSAARWTIAVLGAWYVLAQLTWHDRALVLLDPRQPPVWMTVVQGDENSPQITVLSNGAKTVAPIASVVSEPDAKTVRVAGQPEKLLGVVLYNVNDRFQAARLLVADPTGPKFISPSSTDYQVVHPHPRIQVGVRHLLASARHWYLLWSLLVFPINFLITSFRWHELLKPLDIVLAPTRSFVLNMVGCFYNTFMPGSTGGDVLKAYYVARQTHHRTRAVMSVVVDRIIGLLALIILGGVMAAYAAAHHHIQQTASVAVGAGLIILGTAMGLSIFYYAPLRRLSGLDWLLSRLPMQQRVQRAVETMHLYGRRPGLVAGALVISFPVHTIVILSATFAGIAFGLHIPWTYYWTVVPVSVLAGSIPISPQGAGVMEYFAIWMLSPLGCTVAEAVVLTMSIRLVQVLWNLSGGFFVLRGGYHAPTIAQSQEAEQEDLDGRPAERRDSAINLSAETN